MVRPTRLGLPVGYLPMACGKPERPRKREEFRRDESGGMIIFALFIFVMMLLAGGMAIDLMRTETTRTRLQATLDSAVLAAADMDQDIDAGTVVRDYVTRAGMDPYLVDVQVTDVGGLKQVTAEARANVPTMFMNMDLVEAVIREPIAGINYFPAPARATATESVQNLEISLVLDISGSMQGDKIEELQDAAVAFSDVVLNDSGAESVRINVVPYATQVSVPSLLFDSIVSVLETLGVPSLSREHGFSNCVDFAASEFDSTSLLSLTGLTQTAHFDPFLTWGPENGPDGRKVFTCNPDPSTGLLTQADSLDTITPFVEGLTADGNTSIEIGMKWGSALLDPGMGTVLNILQNGLLDGLLHPVSAYDDTTTDKIIVLMTDGANTTEYRLDDWLSGPSDVYIDDARGELWVRATDHYDADRDGRRDSDVWFRPSQRSTSYYEDDGDFWLRDREWPHYCSGWNCDISDNVRQLTYEELFNEVSVYYNAYYHHYLQNYDSREINRWYWDAMTSIGPNEKNDRLEDICDAVKAEEKGVIVYAVGFEVNDDSAAVMANCASTDSHFFRVAGEDLTSAFEQIARQVAELRLTQ